MAFWKAIAARQVGNQLQTFEARIMPIKSNLLLALLSIAATAHAAPGIKPQDCENKPFQGKGLSRFAFENDLFSQTDRYYTDGFKWQWVSPTTNRQSGKCHSPDWAQQAADVIYGVVGGSGSDKIYARNATWALGQDMFTPAAKTIDTLIPNDRPYAGWLYLAFGLNGREHIEEPGENDIEVLHSLEYNIGIVGPSAAGKQVQDTIHDARGLARFAGWANQLRDEPGVKITYERKWRFGSIRNTLCKSRCDLIAHLGATVGNVQTYVNGGFEVRYGDVLPDDFGTSPIRPGGNSDAPIAGKRSGFIKKNWHLFMAANGRVVARDIFLDGNTWKDSHRIDKHRLVADVAYGAVWAFDSFSVSYFKVARSREFVGQVGTQRFGGLLFSWE